MRIKSLLFCLIGIFTHTVDAHGEESLKSTLLLSSEGKPKQKESLLLFITANGQILSDSGTQIASWAEFFDYLKKVRSDFAPRLIIPTKLLDPSQYEFALEAALVLSTVCEDFSIIIERGRADTNRQ